MTKDHKTSTKKLQRSKQAAKNRTKYKRSVGDIQNSFEFNRKRNQSPLGIVRLTPETINQIATALEKGHHPETAIAGCGLSYPTFLSYLNRGKQDYERLEQLDKQGVHLRDEDYSLKFDLYMKVQKALYSSQDTPLTVIQQAGVEGDWRASAHFLERRFPKQWGKKLDQRVEATTTVNSTVQTVIMVPKRAESIEEWQALTKARKLGNLEYDTPKALPGSSGSEIPEDSALSFEGLMNA